MEYLLALAAAVLLGVGFVFQQHAAGQVPTAQFLRLRLLGSLLRQPWWLMGAAAMAAGQLGAAWVVGHLELSVAEPLLASNLIFALLLAALLSRQRAARTELIGAVVLSAGVAALALTRAPKSAAMSFGSLAYWPAAAVIGLIAYALVRAGRRRVDEQRALLTGTAAGLVLGIADALTRMTVHLLTARDLDGVFTSWPVYGLAGAGFAGFFLMQSSFNAGPLHASLPGIAAAEPLSGIVLGIVVFNDPVAVSAGMLALRAAGSIALIIGVILVARAPALSRLRRLPLPNHGGTPGRGNDAQRPFPGADSGAEALPEQPVL